jgi:hypothetical protein
MDDDTLYLASLSGEELQNFIVGSASGYTDQYVGALGEQIAMNYMRRHFNRAVHDAFIEGAKMVLKVVDAKYRMSIAEIPDEADLPDTEA